jgi:hypothetical protein
MRWPETFPQEVSISAATVTEADETGRISMARGDHLYVDRMAGLYSHHGIDCGDGTVIHYWPDGPLPTASVRRTSWDEFAEGGPVKARYYPECDPPDKVMERAEGSLGARGFSPLSSNCEHFAVWCKTGNGESSQPGQIVTHLLARPDTAAVSIILAPVLVPAAVFGVFANEVLNRIVDAAGAQNRASW